MTILAQMVAVEAGVKDDAGKAVSQAQNALRADPKALHGITKVFTPLDPEDVQHHPQVKDQRVAVQVVAEDVLGTLAADLRRLFDVTYTKEAADTRATADVVVPSASGNGELVTLVADAPVAYLLFLEKQVDRLLERIAPNLPVLDPAEQWAPTDQRGVSRTAPVEQQYRTKSRVKFEKFAGNEHHAPQVEVFDDDVVTGHFAVTKFSGALPYDRARLIVDRLRLLKRAVIAAREQANTIEVEDLRAGDAVFGWLLAR